MLRRLLVALAAILACATAALAEEPQLTPEQKAEIARLEKILASLEPQRGSVLLPKAKARLALGDGYYFLGPADARKVLVDGWGNPPAAADGVLGIIFPAGKTFLDETWGAVVTYEKTFYVSDADARSADYDQLLNDMKSGEAAANEERRKAGYESIHLVGWAQPPTYDPARHDLIWAREIRFGEQTDNTLNYDVRHLGREGVLSLNMISSMSQLAEVRAAAQALAKTAEFEAGSRYADYREGDKKAEFGLAGLVAAGAGVAVAKKLGFLAVLLAFAKKGLVFLVAGAAGLWAWMRRRFGRRSKDLDLGASAAPSEPSPEDPPPTDRAA